MNNKVNDKTYIKLTPFKGWVLENFPFIESDFDCITNYQLLCKITEYLNNVISNQNQVQQLGTELVTAYNQLLDYVNNYFDNLDVQEEINNKLDSLVEDGTLTTLISSYLQPYVDEQNARINVIDNKVDSVASGSPIPVSNTSQMTDTTKVYLLTSDGYWYYYNGESWTQGGVYQASRDIKDVENGLYGQLFESIATNDLTYRYNTSGQQNGTGVSGDLYGTRTITNDINQGYSFLSYDLPTNKIYLTFKLSDITKFHIYGRRNSSNAFDLTNYISLGDRYASIIDPALIDSSVTSIRVAFDNRQGTEPLVLSNYMAMNNHIYSEVLNKIDTQINNINKVVYVNATYPGTSDGTAKHPYKTIQDGINSGADTIRIYPGWYEENLTISNKKKLHMEAIMGSYSSGSKQSKVEILARENLTFNTSGSLVRCDYATTSDSMMYKCFVSQTEDIKDTSSPRSAGYKCNLWYIDDVGTTIKLIPKLSQNECEETENSWFYDGTTIYANTTHTNLTLCNGDKNCGLRFEECTDIRLSGIKILFSNNAYALYMKRCENVVLDNCEVHYSNLGNGFYGNQSNIVFNNCIANYNRNDGFNFDNYGSSTFNDCKAFYNFDDGISHHGGCVGYVNGGEVAYNHKGGFAPVYLSAIDVNGLYSHNNTYGILTSGSETINVFNSCFKSNGIDLKLEGKTTNIYNVKYTTSQTTGGAVLNNLDN